MGDELCAWVPVDERLPSHNATVLVWPPDGGSPRALTGHDGEVLDVAIDHDAHFVHSAGSDGTTPAALTVALPAAVQAVVPGTHMSCVTKPDLGEAIRDFLTGTAAR